MTTNSIHTPENQTKILLVMLKHVAFDGWTMASLHKAVLECGFSEADVYRAFEGNPRYALDCFFTWVNRETEKALQQRPLVQMKIRERITEVIWSRLQLLDPHKEAVRKTLAYLACPTRMPLGLKYLYQAVDSMWYAVGDTSTDFSYYTRRATLAAVYSSTLAKWLNDSSDDYIDTKRFLEKRIENVMVIPKIKNKIKKFIGR